MIIPSSVLQILILAKHFSKLWNILICKGRIKRGKEQKVCVCVYQGLGERQTEKERLKKRLSSAKSFLKIFLLELAQSSAYGVDMPYGCRFMCQLLYFLSGCLQMAWESIREWENGPRVGAQHPHGKPKGSSLLPDLDQPSSSYCKPMGRESVVERSLFSLFLSWPGFKVKNKSEK